MKGLRILKSVITEEEEEALISYIDSQKWDNRFTRRTQYYGIDYHHRTRNLVKIGPIPDELVPKQVSSLITPEAIIVNEYEDISVTEICSVFVLPSEAFILIDLT